MEQELFCFNQHKRILPIQNIWTKKTKQSMSIQMLDVSFIIRASNIRRNNSVIKITLGEQLKSVGTSSKLLHVNKEKIIIYNYRQQLWKFMFYK
jgi:hypothetical protein